MARRVIAISGVRNERDIIEAFVRHTTALVDHLIVVDNGSTDETRDILASLAADIPALVARYGDSIGFQQARWMTELMAEAAREPQAEWILPLDADEFLPANINALLFRPRPDNSPRRPVRIPLRTYLPGALESPAEINPVLRMHQYLVKSPEPWISKVIVPIEFARMPGIALEQGNHCLSCNSELIESEPADEFVLSHFPVRSVGQYTAKIAIGWLQYLTMSERADAWGYHWRSAYEQLKKDSFALSVNFPEEVLHSCGAVGEPFESETTDGQVEYLGGPLKYTPGVADRCYPFEQLLCYAERLACYIRRQDSLHDSVSAELQATRDELGRVSGRNDSVEARLRTLQAERDDLEHKLNRIEQSRGWSVIQKYRRWIGGARQGHVLIRRLYEPIAEWMVRKIVTDSDRRTR